MPVRYVSQNIKRQEDPPLLMGKANFMGDLRPAGLLTVAFLRSPHAHARIVGVDLAAARALPGVVAILTGDDLATSTRPVRAVLSGSNYKETGWPAMAVGKTRFVGELVAAVVASDRYAAEDAVEAIQVTYEELPVVADVAAAMRADAPRIHEEISDNVYLHAHYEKGDVQKLLDGCEIRLKETMRQARTSSAPMEGRATMAMVDPVDETLTVWASSQSPHMLRTGLAEALGVTDSQIRVRCPHVGGGFGPKMHMYPEDIVVADIARRLRRPVRWLEDRRENLLASAQSRDHVQEIEIGARADGTIVAIRTKILADGGAYSMFPTSVALEPMTAAGLVPGPYHVQGYAYDAYALITNKCPLGAYRGVGMAPATFVRERLVDMIAHRAGLDPAVVRRRNFVEPRELPYVLASGLTMDSGDVAGAYAQALEVAGYDKLREEPRTTAAGKYRGVGAIAYIEFTGMGAGTFRRRGMVQVSGHDSATVRVEPTGEVRGFVSAASQGQGHSTTFAQILADELGVDIGAVKIVAGDTERCPYGSGSFASRSIVVSGGALVLAARRVREKITAIAAHILEAAAQDLTIEAGRIEVRGAPGRAVTVGDVAQLAYRPASGTLPPGVDPALEATQYYDPPPATFSNGAHVAVVDVDPDTGMVEIVKYVVVEDCGKMVNPMIVEGQTHGAVAQGIGHALYEDLAYGDGAQPLTTTFMDYLIPGTMEVPDVEVIHTETPPAVSVTGFKGMAEGGTIGSTAAVANAVADALAPHGIEVRELPLTPDRVLRLIRDKRA